MRKKFRILTAFLFISIGSFCQPKPGTLDIFMGVDFNYRDLFWNNRVYDVLVNLTPGIKWNMGHHWEVVVQAYVPVVNQYGERYKKVRVNMAALSKQMAVGEHWKMKLTGGWFSSERYGFDLKNMFILKRWLALTAQVGLTGHCSMAAGWECSKMQRFTYQVGPQIYLHRWNTEFRLRGGRYLFKDYGVVGEAFRHFKHVSIGLYGSYSDKGKEDVGFKVIMMIPPYKRSSRKVNIRPASNFRLTYSIEGNGYANRNYYTDPEQNERESWFDKDLLPWGIDSTISDFEYMTKTERRGK